MSNKINNNLNLTVPENNKSDYTDKSKNCEKPITSTEKITWPCPDCKGNHTTTVDRKYYCTLLCRF